ncbi:MAG: hypothetical protein Q7T07_03985, partial [Burkholderiaceae bacterium]|nr:hypothetical protein [Burkholderiaceae bacterium]
RRMSDDSTAVMQQTPAQQAASQADADAALARARRAKVLARRGNKRVAWWMIGVIQCALAHG